MEGDGEGTTTFFFFFFFFFLVQHPFFPSPQGENKQRRMLIILQMCLVQAFSPPLRGGAADRKATGEASGEMTQPENFTGLS